MFRSQIGCKALEQQCQARSQSKLAAIRCVFTFFIPMPGKVDIEHGITQEL